jgi:tripartite-type tricarboxylate transporter receptor subunit TctC
MKPDGSVFFVGAIHHTIAPSIYKALDYDLEKDFEPITMIALVPQVISINPAKVPVKTYAEFLAYVKANPGKVNYASPGAGTAHHLAGELYKLETKTDVTHIPYRGAGPAMQDLLAGNADMMFDGMGTSATQIRGGRLLGLAVATPKRLPEFPDIPTAAEVGVPNWIVSTWYGLWAIKGTPKPIVDRMYTEMVKAMEMPKLQAIWKDQTAQMGGESQQDFAKRIRAEIEKWQKVVAAAGVKLD